MTILFKITVVAGFLIFSVASKSCYIDFEDDSSLLDFDLACNGALGSWKIDDRPNNPPPPPGAGDRVLVNKVLESSCMITTKQIEVNDYLAVSVDLFLRQPDYPDFYSLDLDLLCQDGDNYYIWNVVRTYNDEPNGLGEWMTQSTNFTNPPNSKCKLEIRMYRNGKAELAIDRIVIENVPSTSNCFGRSYPDEETTTDEGSIDSSTSNDISSTNVDSTTTETSEGSTEIPSTTDEPGTESTEDVTELPDEVTDTTDSSVTDEPSIETTEDESNDDSSTSTSLPSISTEPSPPENPITDEDTASSTNQPTTDEVTNSEGEEDATTPSTSEGYLEFEDESDLLAFENDCNGIIGIWLIEDRPNAPPPPAGAGNRVLTNVKEQYSCLRTKSKVDVRAEQTITVDLFLKKPLESDYYYLEVSLVCDGNVNTWTVLDGTEPKNIFGKWLQKSGTFVSEADSSCYVQIGMFRNGLSELAVDRLSLT